MCDGSWMSVDDTEATLVAAIIAAPDDDLPRAVYADWLTERGDLRGELIVLQLLAEPTLQQRQRIDELLARHRDRWVGGAATDAWKLDWQRGFVGRAAFELDASADRTTIDDAGEAASVHSYLDHADPTLRELALILCHYDAMIPAVVAEIATREWPNLRSLELGFRGFHCEMDGHYNDGWLVPDELVPRMCAALPALRELTIRGHLVFSELAHPTLEVLRLIGGPAIAGCGMDEVNWDGAGIDLPQLHTLTLRIVTMCQSGQLSANQLALDHTTVPRLRDLVLDFDSDEGTALPWLVDWPGTRTLETVAFPSLDEAENDASHLERARAVFAHLRAVTVEKLIGEPSFIRAVHAAIPQLRVRHR